MRTLGRPIRGGAAAACALIVALFVVVGVTAGCSKDGTAGTTTTGASTGGTTRSTSIIVGDKTKEDYQASLPDLEAKTKADPSDLKVLLDLAVAYYKLNRFQDAASVYERMLKLGEDPTLRNNYANMLRDMGKLGEAEAAYRRALDEDPKLVAAYINLAGLLDMEGKKDDAFKVLDEGIAKLEGTDKSRLETVKTALQKAK